MIGVKSIPLDLKSSCASSRVRFAANRGDIKLEDIVIFPIFLPPLQL